jgi:hypothetical protein
MLVKRGFIELAVSARLIVTDRHNPVNDCQSGRPEVTGWQTDRN